MTQTQIALVKETWGLVARNPKAAGVLFYNRLFELAPEVAPMFHHDMPAQVEKLMQTLDYIVSSLDSMDKILEDVKALGQRHAGYGVKDKHYPLVGMALLWTLEKGLGHEWNEDVKTAWLDTYTELSAAMIEATKQPAPESMEGVKAIVGGENQNHTSLKKV